jgi:hypothetical protein
MLYRGRNTMEPSTQILQKYGYTREKFISSIFKDSLLKDIEIFEKYEHETGTRVFPLGGAFIKEQFNIKWRHLDSVQYRSPSQTNADKLFDSIENMPWDAFWGKASNALIVGDIYMMTSYAGHERLRIWAADFTKPYGRSKVGRSDEQKTDVYYCDMVARDDNGDTYSGVALFAPIEDRLHWSGLSHEFFHRNMRQLKEVKSRLPTHYRISEPSTDYSGKSRRTLLKIFGRARNENEFYIGNSVKI